MANNVYSLVNQIPNQISHLDLFGVLINKELFLKEHMVKTAKKMAFSFLILALQMKFKWVGTKMGLDMAIG